MGGYSIDSSSRESVRRRESIEHGALLPEHVRRCRLSRDDPRYRHSRQEPSVQGHEKLFAPSATAPAAVRSRGCPSPDNDERHNCRAPRQISDGHLQVPARLGSDRIALSHTVRRRHCILHRESRHRVRIPSGLAEEQVSRI